MMKSLKSVIKYYSKGFIIVYLLLISFNIKDFNFLLLLEQSIYGAIGFALLIYAIDSLFKNHGKG